MIDDLKRRPEELAKEILEIFYGNPENYEGKDLKEKTEHQKAMLGHYLRLHEMDFEAGRASNPVILAKIMNTLSTSLFNIGLYSEDATLLKNSIYAQCLFKKVYSKVHGRSMQSFVEGEEEALFILGLKIFGSSILQAKKSVAEWVGKSLTSVESYYTNLDGKEDYLELSKDTHVFFFGYNDIKIANILIRNAERSFPTSKITDSAVRKTYNAYMDFVAAFREYVMTDTRDFGHFGGGNILEDDYYSEKANEIKDKFLAQY